MPPQRRQSAAEGASLARYGVRAVDRGIETQGLMAKPCTPHLHCAARATLRAKSLQCKPFSGGSKGGVLFCEREYPLCPVQRQRRCNLPRPWQGKRKSTTTFVVMLYGAGDEARTRFPASREPPYGDSQEPCLTSDLMRLRRGWRQRVLSA